jgi:hypothetical protein
LRDARERLKSILEHAFEQKTEQYLRPQDKEARFVQRGLYSPVQFQDNIVGLCGAVASRGRQLGIPEYDVGLKLFEGLCVPFSEP